MKEHYLPQPIDTSSVHVPEELNELAEKLARNTHEVWARARMAQGWTYGEIRNDRLKQHPDLIPFEELTEEEADYDRSTSIQVIKLILSLGFRIEKNDDLASPDVGCREK